MASKNNGTWREQRSRLKPKTSETVYFNETKPNHILISNPVPYPLYVGVSGTVDPSTYDLVIPPYGTRLYARMMYTTRLYLYSDSIEPVDIQLTSWEDEFNPASIAQSTEMVGAGANGLLGIVEVNNILGSIPTGTNVIGGVFVSEFGASLPQGNNHIGRVEVESGSIDVLSLPQDGASYKRISADAAADVVVKSGKGYVYQLASDDDVQLFDAAAAAWKKGEFASHVPLTCSNSIVVRLSGPGEAFLLYK